MKPGKLAFLGVGPMWLVLLAVSGCSSKNFVTDSDEVANAVGEAAASLDEMLGASGAVLAAGQFHVLHGANGEEDTELTGPERLSCLVTTPLSGPTCLAGSSFGSGSGSGSKTWNLNGECSSGLRTAVSGTVTFGFSDSLCALASPGQSVSRQVSHSMTGKKMGTLTSSSSTSGQALTRTSSGFTFTVNDLSRTLAWDTSDTAYHYAIRTPESWLVTGLNSAGRTVNSGSIELRQSEFGWTAALTITTPLVQTSACNCPVSGKLEGAITGDEEDEDFGVEFTGCGTAQITAQGRYVLPVKLDRCAPL